MFLMTSFTTAIATASSIHSATKDMTPEQRARYFEMMKSMEVPVKKEKSSGWGMACLAFIFGLSL